MYYQLEFSYVRPLQVWFCVSEFGHSKTRHKTLGNSRMKYMKRVLGLN